MNGPERVVKTIRVHPDDVARNAAALRALHRSAGGYVTKAADVATAGWSRILGVYADSLTGDPAGRASWAAFKAEEPALARLVPFVVDEFNEGHAVGDLLAEFNTDGGVTPYRPAPALKAAGQRAEPAGLDAGQRAYLDRVYRTHPDPTARNEAYRLLHENDG